MRSSLDSLGIVDAKVHHNLSVPALVEHAVKRGEGVLTSAGALAVRTGKYTGRSPNDKYVVDSQGVHNQIDWSNNAPISEAGFDNLFRRITAYLQNRDVFVFDGFAGADPSQRVSIRFINELAWQGLFSNQLFIRPTVEQLEEYEPEWIVIAAPGFKAVPEQDGTRSEAAIVLNFEKKMVLIAGSQYGGEIKKSVFTLLNYIMPLRDIASMHCSANLGDSGDVAIFFGLSGTGKTSLSADAERTIIGDDQHGWGENGIFNYEGGCYAKCINLSREFEPLIWDSIRFGAVVENVVFEPCHRQIDFADASITENTRAAYPINFIPRVHLSGMATHPSTVFFLTADAFGVLPPISKLTPEGLMFHFLSGYTSKLAGTERGITEPQATFSTCFGAPFLPLHPLKYAELLAHRASKHGSNVYLVNTGWTRGPYGVGSRISIKYTRAMVSAALDGSLDRVPYSKDPVFNVMVPDYCPNVPTELLKPRGCWEDKQAYDRTANELARSFVQNFSKFTSMPEEVKMAGPVVN